MSYNSDEQNNSTRKNALFILKDSSQFPHWKRTVETYLFRKAKITNLEKLTVRSYLDEKYFKKLL